MNYLTESYVDSLALNSSAIKNGKDLVKKIVFRCSVSRRTGRLFLGSVKVVERTRIDVRSMWRKRGIPYSAVHARAVSFRANTISV